MKHLLSGSALLALVAGSAACVGEESPPPQLTVTSPVRGLMQDTGHIVVTGTTGPNANGDAVQTVSVNGVAAQLGADGTFTATLDVADGMTILETTAICAYGGSTTDARAVQSGVRHPVGSTIPQAIAAQLSAATLAKIAAAAGPAIKQLDLPSMLDPTTPIVSLGDSTAGMQMTLTKFQFGDVKVTLVPVAGGLQFSAEIDQLSVGVAAAYNAVIVNGTENVTADADSVIVGGTLVVTPAGNAGFTTSIASPHVATNGLHLTGSGLVGTAATFLGTHLGDAVNTIATKAAAKGIEPAINLALGALAGPQRLTILGQTLNLEATPSAVAFDADGGLVMMDLGAAIAGSESSPGYILTPNGTPTMDANAGIELAVSDDLINEMVAEIHAKGLLDLAIPKNLGGIVDNVDLKLSMPPMVSADNKDGTLRLLIGDMVATLTNKGVPVLKTAVNAQIDVKIERGATPDQIAIDFGKVDMTINFLDDPNQMAGGFDIKSIIGNGIDIQTQNLGQFLVKVPVPQVAGLSFDNLAVHADSGYLLMSGDIH